VFQQCVQIAKRTVMDAPVATVEKDSHMSKFRIGMAHFFATALVAFSMGCGKETINVPDSTAPYVLSTVPAQGAAGVALSAPISATFSEAVTPSTISATTFTVTALVRARGCVRSLLSLESEMQWNNRPAYGQSHFADAMLLRLSDCLAVRDLSAARQLTSPYSCI
jgi:hypothetical protein